MAPQIQTGIIHKHIQQQELSLTSSYIPYTLSLYDFFLFYT